MTSSLELTFDYLATTENEAATTVLLAALDHPDRAVADGALRAVLRRKSPEALDELVRRWHEIGDRAQDVVALWPGVLAGAIKQAFYSSNEQLIRNAAAAAVAVADYELVSLFAIAVSEPHPLRRKLAAEALLHFSETLYEELHGNRPGKVRRDAQLVRKFVAGCLEGPVARFASHGCCEVLEAFLLVAGRENATFRHLLQDVHEPSHAPLCEQLLRSTRPAAMRLLLSFLDDPHAPVAAIRLIGRRCDVSFFHLLCSKLVTDHSCAIEPNLARIDRLPWIEESPTSAELLEESEQPGAVKLVWRSKIDSRLKRRMLQQLLKHGAPLGREVAARALFDLLGDEADSLLLRLLEDECPLVQAAAVSQLRPRDLPNALSLLIDFLDSPYPEVQAAARGSLEEFTFARYLSAFDTLAPEVRKATGTIVQRVNPSLAEELVTELVASGRARRMRAMHVAVALNLVREMEFGLIELCRDEDHTVRLEAARLLGQCPSQEARHILQDLLSDPSTAVQNRAELSLHEMAVLDLEEAAMFGEDWFMIDDTKEVSP